MSTLNDFRREAELKIFEKRPNLAYFWGPEIEPPFMRFRLYHRWIQPYKFKSLQRTFDEIDVGPELVINDLGATPSSEIPPRQRIAKFDTVDPDRACGQITNVIVDEIGISAEGVIYFTPAGDALKRVAEHNNYQLRPRILTTCANFAHEPALRMMRLIAIDIDTSAPAIEDSFIEIIK